VPEPTSILARLALARLALARMVPARLGRRGAGALGLAMVLLAASPLHAGEARPLADDPTLEARMMAVADTLRCVVCQNETVAASHAELARDLRAQIRQQLQAGRSEQQVRDFMVARYGDFVLYRPPLQPSTAALWLGPFALLALAALVWWRYLRRASATARRGGSIAAAATPPPPNGAPR